MPCLLFNFNFFFSEATLFNNISVPSVASIPNIYPFEITADWALSYFEIVFATIIKPNDEVKNKKDLEKIILCDVQIEIYPDLEKTFLNLMHNSGYPDIKFEKKIDFEKLYNERSS